MNDIASQPVMSMYSTDPGTGLTIISPRVYRLRQLQACEGVNLAELRLEQRGLAPITYMHHVSKIIEGNTESYRVRICRTCSGLPTLLELGSYTDVESALLVNDVHELMQDRTKQLHLLCVDDVKYFNSIAVRRRGSPHDLQITSVLQERLWKKSSAASATAKKLLKEITNNETDNVAVAVAAATANSNALKTEQYLDTLDFFETTSFPSGYKGRISSELSGVYSDIINKNDRTHLNQNVEGAMEKSKLQYPVKDVRSSFQYSSTLSSKEKSDNSLVRMSSRNSADDATLNSETREASSVGQGQGQGVTQEALSSDSYTTGQSQEQGSIKITSNVFEAFNDEEESSSGAASSATATSYVTSSFPTESQEGKQAAIPTTGEQGRVGIINRPSSQALSRAGRIVDQFKANLVRYHATFIQWNFFDNPADIDRMFLALADFVGAELTHVISSASMRRNGSRGGGSADSAQAVAVAETNVREAWKVGRAPRSSLLSTIASVFPGNSMEMQLICKRVASIIAQDTPSVSRFNDLYAQAVDEIQKIENDIRAYDFHPYFPATSNDFDTCNEEVAGSVKPVSDDGETSASCSAPLTMPPLSFCFKDCEEFIRQSYNAASYFDHSLRLCSWDGELSGVQEAEVKLHGIYSQLENRFIAVTQFLLIVTSANTEAIKHASARKAYFCAQAVCKESDSEAPAPVVSEVLRKDDREEDVEEDVGNDLTTDYSLSDIEGPVQPVGCKRPLNPLRTLNPLSSPWMKADDEGASTQGSTSGSGDTTILADELPVEVELAALLRKTTLCVTYSILALTSAASVAWRLCGDALSASSCIRACNNFLPILVENVSDPSILQEFIQRHLDLMTSIILYSGRSQMLGSGFGVLGPSNDGGRNFVFTRYRPSDMNGNTRDCDDQELSETGRSSSSSRSGQSLTELRLLAFSLGGEIVKQSRRCFATFPKQLTGPAAMIHFEAAFRAYVAIFLASLALEESDLLAKLGYTIERLLSATNDVLSSLQERITKQNCTLVSTHTLISLHAMAEACIFHSKRHVDCANTVFMIVRSCRLLLWGCSPRFVLAKMLLEHIAAEESKRLFADDKEQAAHLMTLKSAADQASSNVADVPSSDIPAYSSSVNTIFSPFDQLDKYGIIHSSSQESEGMADLVPSEGQQLTGTSSKRYHTETSDRHALRPDASLVCAVAKKKKAAISSSSIKAARIAAESKMRPTQLSSSSTTNILDVVNTQNQHQHLLQYDHHRSMFLGNQNQPSYDSNSSEGRVDFGYEAPLNVRQPPLPFQTVNSQHFQPQSSGQSFGFPPRSLYEKQMMTMNRCSSNSSTSLHTMNGGGSSWTTDGSALDSISHYHIPASTAASMSSSYSVSSGLSSNNSNSNSNLALSDMQLDVSSIQHSDLLSCKVSSMHVDLHQNQNQRHWQQQQWLHQQRQQFQQQQQPQQQQQQPQR